MWTPTDAVKFREYLTHNHGTLIAHLTEIVPSITVGADSKVEGVAIQGAFKEGYLFALQRIKEMAIIPNKQDDASSSAYVAM
jgi:hypothetical protein